MRLLLLSLLCTIFLFFSLADGAFAVVDPVSVPNNKVGIHILFPEEVSDAAKLVNSARGDWGYITIPIQSGDKNIVKWQKFMDDCKALHLIPLVRLATEGDYFNTKVWRRPQDTDIVDFANFLSSLNWPVKNRYIIVFNEVNRNDEWGGQVNPAEYAQILNYATTVFKSKSQDFFMISSGLDNASINIPGQSMNTFTFLQQMQLAEPGIFNQIDGFSSHSYPNPAFSKHPTQLDAMSIATFSYERQLVLQYRIKQQLPIFITETGWSQDALSQERVSHYFQLAFNNPWNDKDIVAVTPFLLTSGAGPFTMFSFTNPDGQPRAVYTAIQKLQKTKGMPVLTKSVLGETVSEPKDSEVKDFNEIIPEKTPKHSTEKLANMLEWIAGIR